MGDALRAALALDRTERSPAARTAARAAEARGWIARLAPPENARMVRTVSALPLTPHGHELSWGSLSFDTGGKLVVRTRAGPVRVDPETGDETSADTRADWRGAVVSPDGATRWIETYDPCDGVALHATFASGDDLQDVPLPVAPPLGDRCVGSRGVPVQTLPLAWGPGGIQAFVDGEPVLVAPDLSRALPLSSFFDPPAKGGPRSPDGSALVVPTGTGLLVRSGARTRVLRAPELEGAYGELQGCTVGNDASRVACVRRGRAWVATWDLP
jgi:hypothetical protein